MLQKAIPVLLTHNIGSTINFYDYHLGFKGINMGSYTNLKNGTAEIRFEVATAHKPFITSEFIIITQNIEDLYSSLSSKDIIYPQGQLILVVNGKKSFTVKDINGHLIHFQN